jgi:hypothetical protein
MSVLHQYRAHYYTARGETGKAHDDDRPPQRDGHLLATNIGFGHCRRHAARSPIS